MKYTFLFIFITIISQRMVAQNPESILPLEAIEGQWYINQTNFPMWLKGDKTNPTFNYTIEKKKGILGLKDEVMFIKKGEQKSIVGFDTPTNNINTSFVWKGKGLMSLLKSKWTILYLDEEENWAIIHFKKTLFTPAGYDVISRDKILSPDLKKSIEAVLKTLKVEAELTTL